MATELMDHENTDLDHLTMSRVQHLRTHHNRLKSISDEEGDAISDWSESDRECCPLSDFESTSNVDGTNLGNRYDFTFDDDEENDEIDQRLPTDSTFLENVLHLSETPVPKSTDHNTVSCLTSFDETKKFKHQQPQNNRYYHYQQQQHPVQERISNTISRKPSIRNERPPQSPLLPARRISSKQVSPRRSTTNTYVLPQTTTISRNRKTITSSSTRYCLQRETTSTSTTLTNPILNESTTSPNSSFHSNEDNHIHQRHLASPNLSQASITNSLVPRVYELKKIFVDDYDYGRLTDLAATKAVPPRNRQKWGTIVHPPFPLGYQQVTPEQITQSVQRLASPSRCRDRHTPIATPSKRYLSVEETDALV